MTSARAASQRSYRVREGDQLTWEITSKPPLNPRPLDLSILHEDDHIVLVDKPAGLVVHPGAGTTTTTLVEALLVSRKLPASDDPTRPGIVHRLDKETSGVILVAKTPEALTALQQQFSARTTAKTYIAVVEGAVAEEEGWIDAPVGRDPRLPSRMAVQPAGREAQTGFSVLQRLDHATLLVVRPRTGRTHQIRVHCRYIGHPVVGDPVYGTRSSRNQAKQHTSSEREPCSEGAGGDPVYGRKGSVRPTESLLG
ncbi:RluA family pseudouridine synthase, partial [Candidatus Bipolaricaulota bacterium]